jgi:hypothetical protein
MAAWGKYPILFLRPRRACISYRLGLTFTRLNKVEEQEKYTLAPPVFNTRFLWSCRSMV